LHTRTYGAVKPRVRKPESRRPESRVRAGPRVASVGRLSKVGRLLIKFVERVNHHPKIHKLLFDRELKYREGNVEKVPITG
jgi:hypothetical protein